MHSDLVGIIFLSMVLTWPFKLTFFSRHDNIRDVGSSETPRFYLGGSSSLKAGYLV